MRVLRTCRTATHIALGLDALCCLHRSTCCGPWGFSPFSYVFNSNFSVSWVESSNIYGPQLPPTPGSAAADEACRQLA
ncbi:hypothetical protein AB1Y20_012800 [Prymnesium parvum]|uniref:Secreted protein n=1 Tax=Prymnesium parvum TaxID=97485 RepID=A0AB34ILK3_PRYPA